MRFSVLERGQGTSDQVVKIVGSSNVERDITRGNGSVQSIMADGRGQVLRNGKTEAIPSWAVNSAKVSEFPFPGLLDRIADIQTQISLINDTDALGLVHYKLSRVNPTGKAPQLSADARVYESDVYFDQAGHLVKEKHWIFSPAAMVNNVLIEVDYSDYRTVGSVDAPYRITKKLGNVIISDATLLDINLHANNLSASF